MWGISYCSASWREREGRKILSELNLSPSVSLHLVLRAVSRGPPNPVTLNETNILLRSSFGGSEVLLIWRTLVPSTIVTDYFQKRLRKHKARFSFSEASVRFFHLGSWIQQGVLAYQVYLVGQFSFRFHSCNLLTGLTLTSFPQDCPDVSLPICFFNDIKAQLKLNQVEKFALRLCRTDSFKDKLLCIP